MKRIVLLGALAVAGTLLVTSDAQAQRRGGGDRDRGARGGRDVAREAPRQSGRSGRSAGRGGVQVDTRRVSGRAGFNFDRSGISGRARVGLNLGRTSLGFGVNFGRGSRDHVRDGSFHGRRRGHHRGRPVRVKVPVYEKIWIPPVYRTVLSGYTRCGRPIYDRICVRRGYYKTVIKCYRWETRYH